MNMHIDILEDNNWICDYEDPWGSLLLLSPKPHQEGCTDINDFIWRLCISYRSLKGVTKSLEFPIPRYSDSIEGFGDSSGRICFISLDISSGYHHIRVRTIDQEKSVFFTRNRKYKTFKLILFGLKKHPLYTTMMILAEGLALIIQRDKAHYFTQQITN